MLSVCHYYATSDCQPVSLSHISQALCSPFFFLHPICLSLSLSPPISRSPFFLAAIFTSSHPPSAPTLPLPSIHSSVLVSFFFSGCLLLPPSQSAVTFPPPLPPLLLSSLPIHHSCYLCASTIVCRACMYVCVRTCARQLESVNECPLQCQTCCVQSMLLPVTHILCEYIRLANNTPLSVTISSSCSVCELQTLRLYYPTRPTAVHVSHRLFEPSPVMYTF